MDALAIVPAGTIEVDGLVTPYYDSGTDHEGQLPLVLVHGSAGTTRLHFNFLYPLLATNRRVIALDWQTPTDRPLEVDIIVDQILAVVDRVVPGREVAIMGYSLGAVAAIATAAARPEQVRRLIPVAGWMKSDAHQEFFARVWQDLHKANSPQLVPFTLRSALGAPFMVSLLKEQLEMILSMTALGPEVASQMELNSRVDITERLEKVTATSLIVAFTYDNLVPLHHGSQLFGAIEDSRYVEIQCGHSVFIERPAELLRAVDMFLLNPTAYPAGATIPPLVP